MKFRNIFLKTEKRAEEALLSLWTRNHPMRDAFAEMLKKEPLLGEPVFQSLFGWEPTNDDNWQDYFEEDVIEALKIDPPYLHQTKSWRALSGTTNKQSIVVTSGTGSGKTQCFMYPVLNDLCKNRQQGAIQAIFLYPLNALMEDQCDRLRECCDALNLRFAVYNGNTKEYGADNGNHDSEVRTRKEIRDAQTTPQILLTNPSMLEYMLLRDSDQDMIQRSQGQLRWIVIDEAHTYSGSAAVELANQIRRILNAFGTTPNQVHFACTSATIGGSDALLDFISFLISQDKKVIDVIDGYRQVPDISNEVLSNCLIQNGIPVAAPAVQFLRNEINSRAGLTLKNIWDILNVQEDYSTERALELIDQLCEMKCDDVDGKPSHVLMVRAHFFMRVINGIYACVAPDCTHYTASPIGRITSYRTAVCEHCGAPMIELVQCMKCGKVLLSGEYNVESHVIRPLEWIASDDNPFALSESDGEDVEENEDKGYEDHEGWSAFIVGCEKDQNAYQSLSSDVYLFGLHFIKDSENGNVQMFFNTERPDSFVEAQKDNVKSSKVSICCPECNSGMSKNNTKRFAISVDSINKIVAPVLLNETREDDQHEWGRYITFTDSRQGTAISTKTFNVDVERKYAQAHLVRFLQEKRDNFRNTQEYQKAVATVTCLKRISEADDKVQELINQNQAIIDDANQPQPLTQELAEFVSNITLCEHLSGMEMEKDNYKFDDQWRSYKPAVMRNLIGRRSLSKPSVESLGFVTLVYKKLDKIQRPKYLIDYSNEHPDNKFTDLEWRNFLKIAIDYVIREGNHIQPFADHEREYTRDYNVGSPIFPSGYVLPRNDTHDKAIRRWPSVDPNNPNRLVLLLCAALGITSPEDLNQDANLRLVQNLMREAWNDLVDYMILTKVCNNGLGYNDVRFYKNGRDKTNTDGYYLDMSIKTSDTPDNDICIKLLEKATYCPVTRRLLDVTFKGFSPAISGELSRENIERYKCSQEYTMPKSLADVENVNILKNVGLWSDIHEDIYKCCGIYVSAEHSAQQPRPLLKHYTEEFRRDNYCVNILNCSTTMEMGVDIGSISLVLLDSVPPYAANYLQRAGRAGRSGQSRAVVLSMCNSTATGEHAFRNPMWALNTHVAMRTLRKSSVIEQRHINSFFFQIFVSETQGGMRGTSRVSDFFEDGNPTICDNFVAELNNYLNNQKVKDCFRAVFPNFVFDINITRKKIEEIKDAYISERQKLEDAYRVANNENPNDEYKIRSIRHQILRLRNEMLIGYLAGKQFIPNANMPTSVVEFDHTTVEDLRSKNNILDRISRLRTQLEDLIRNGADSSLIDDKKNEIADEHTKYDDWKRATTASREARVALNEYAPGQTVVIGEKNFVSEGIQFYGDFENSTPRRHIYRCHVCGHVQLSDIQLNDTQCPSCLAVGQNNPYRSIIFPNGPSFTLAFEPIGYRTYPFTSYDRHEATTKRYYNIRAELLQLDWNNPITDQLCQIVKADEGEVMYYNIGTGYGFAICKKCGKAVLDSNDLNENPLRRHKKLTGSGELCTANDTYRNVLLYGRHQTTLVALRFKNDPNQNTFITDEGTILSLGVMIKRALVEYLGINENEIDFGIKHERNAKVLFVYDTNKGGCGYSTVLYNDTDRRNIFDKAFDMIRSYSCSCHEHENAVCAHCLVDRETQFFAKKLSKANALRWLLTLKNMNMPLPDAVRAEHESAAYSFQSMRGVLLSAINNPNVTDITLCAIDKDIDIVEWNSRAGEIGKLLHNAKVNGKNVHIRLQYDPKEHTDLADVLLLTKLNPAFVDFDLKTVQSLGTMPSALIIRDLVGEKHYFLQDFSDSLNMTSVWGENEKEVLFVENQMPKFEYLDLPTITDIQALLNDGNNIIREGGITAQSFYLGSFFSNTIAPTLLNHNDLDIISGILSGKHVNITYSDNFVNSALACEILYHLIKELRNTYGLVIDNLTLNITQDCVNDRWNEYSAIGYDFPSVADRDQYLRNLFDNENIDIRMPNNQITHHRWLRIKTEDGKSVEIRPDHSIAGGWWSRIPYHAANQINDRTYIMRSYKDTGIVYYIIIRK